MTTFDKNQIKRFLTQPLVGRSDLGSTRKQSRTALRYSKRYNQGLRYMLRTSNGWLVDHDMIDDCSVLVSEDAKTALVFRDFNVALKCGASLLDLFPDLQVHTVQRDWINGPE